MTDLASLIEHAIPEGRQNLENGYANLERIAAYCEANYMQAADKHAALEETKRLTVQSLASVAYQINASANNVLTMLDLQADKINDMEQQLNNIAQIVDIHREKVARREIGVLTTNKSVMRQYKIVTPAHQEKPQTYTRRHIDYSILDDIGHGVKLQPPQNPRIIARTGSTISSGSSGASGALSLANLGSDMPIYLSAGIKTGTIPRNTVSKEYRTPITVAPPTAPIMQNLEYVHQKYPGLVQINQNGQKRISNTIPSNYSQINLPKRDNNFLLAQQQSGGHVTNLASGGTPSADLYSAPLLANQNAVGGGSSGSLPFSTNQQQATILSHVTQQLQYTDDLPPPPMDELEYLGEHSPPLPPPPVDYDVDEKSEYKDESESGNIWIPQNYIEKVLALYDYKAEKPDELSFYENQVIYVMKKNEDGWFEGVLEGVTGLFPGNYVEPCL